MGGGWCRNGAQPPRMTGLVTKIPSPLRPQGKDQLEYVSQPCALSAPEAGSPERLRCVGLRPAPKQRRAQLDTLFRSAAILKEPEALPLRNKGSLTPLVEVYWYRLTPGSPTRRPSCEWTPPFQALARREDVGASAWGQPRGGWERRSSLSPAASSQKPS